MEGCELVQILLPEHQCPCCFETATSPPLFQLRDTMVPRTGCCLVWLLWMFVALPSWAGLVPTDSAGYVAQHNQKRCARGVPPVSWSLRVATSAQNWARSCVFQHCTSCGYAENMIYWPAALSRPTAPAIVNEW